MIKNNNLELEKFKLHINSRLNDKPIVLVGMMGAGKSAIGKLLAKSLNRDFNDIDTNIENKLNLKIHEIFEKFGEQKFREIEFEEIKNIKLNKNSVIATGGGAYTFNRNLTFINENSLSIWIKVNKDIIIKRVSKNVSNRPLLKNKNINEYINNLLRQRNPLYANAHIHVESLNETRINMRNKILLSINKYLEYHK